MRYGIHDVMGYFRNHGFRHINIIALENKIMNFGLAQEIVVNHRYYDEVIKEEFYRIDRFSYADIQTVSSCNFGKTKQN